MIYDVIIIGGGIAGSTAAIYAKMAGLDATIIEKELIGGKLNYISRVYNFPGYLSIEGENLAKNISKQLENLHIETICSEATDVEYINNFFQVYTTGNVYISKYLIIAVGSEPKKIEKIKASYCEICEGHLYKGKNVAVIGGGDSSFSCALYLSNICKTITILIRKDKPKASKFLIDKVIKKSNIKIRYKSDVTEDSKEYDGTFVKIGNVINLEPFKKVIEKNDNTFLIGDCTGVHCNQLIKAANDGREAIEKIKSIMI